LTPSGDRSILGSEGGSADESSYRLHHLGFLRIADRNLARLRAMSGRRCLFGFQPWRSWATVAIMVAMGATLRHSGLPKPWLALAYVAVGTALSLSSVRYWRHAIRGAAASGAQAASRSPDA